MLDLTHAQVDVSRSNDGVWVDLESYLAARVTLTYETPPEGKGCLRVGRWNCPAHRTAQISALEPLYALARKTNVPREIEERETRRSHAGLILDWSNLTFSGAPFPYTKENAEMLVMDPKFVRVDELVIEVARNEETFRARLVEAAQGNS